ncbi:radial spoke head protein, putative [Plasmodium chabaudi adami]|uniref:Radial spoke head protein, putative n=1 Tax=Plasmodium chabaudi adami TaxID=5826 RepID=A0A1D3RV02_PLACE|nr:radial spoke head protein, putative [Plasmodium chabaudi adami]
MENNLAISLNNAKDYLKKKNENGQSVYEHICDMINYIILEKPDKCYDNFELISTQVKENKKCIYKNNNNNSKSILKEIDQTNSTLDNYILTDYIKQKNEWMQKIKKIINEIKYTEKYNEQDINIRPTNLPFSINLFHQLELIKWAGYQINTSLIFYIENSIKNILKKNKNSLISLNFWGILKGINNDYYILEGQLKNYKKPLSTCNKKKKKNSQSSTSSKKSPDSVSSNESTISNSNVSTTSTTPNTSDSYNSEDQKSQDKSETNNINTNDVNYLYTKDEYQNFNKKINKYVYWVSINGTGKWILLKPTTPEYIEKTSKVNKLLTGNINHIITSFPNIQIKEKHYLRALISIISSYTHISPKNYFTIKAQEESEQNEQTDDEENESQQENTQSSDVTDESEGSENDNNSEPAINNKFEFGINLLSNITNWVYSRHYFLPNGHITYPKNKSKKEKHDKNYKQILDLIKQSPPLKILRKIKPQKNNQSNIYTWKIKHLNHGYSYGTNNNHYDIIIIYNFVFYGAFTIYYNKQYFNFYIGTGIKSKHAFIHTYQPDKIYSDNSELSEQDQIE